MINRRTVLKRLAALVAAPVAFCTQRSQARSAPQALAPAPPRYVLDRIDATRDPFITINGCAGPIPSKGWDGMLRLCKRVLDAQGQEQLITHVICDQASRFQAGNHLLPSRFWWITDNDSMPIEIRPAAQIPWIGPVAEGWRRDIALAENQSDHPCVNVYDYPQGRPQPPDVFPMWYRVTLTRP